MPLAVNTPGGQVQLMDLPFEVLEKLEAETDRRWSQLVLSPAMSARSAMAVYRECCAIKGCEPLTLTPRMIASDEVFVEVPDDLPTTYTDGIPDPKAGED